MTEPNLDEIRRRADDGDPEAQYEIGWRTALGMGLPMDDKAAVPWIVRAARQGHMLAQNNLGARHLSGDGVAEDPVRAWAWFHLAAQQGDRKAGKNEESVAARLSPDELNQARRLAESLLNEPEP